MKLPRLSADELRALRAPGNEDSRELAGRIKAHLAAGLAAHVSVDVHVLPAAAWIGEGNSPRMRADDELLAAWVAARFGSADVHQPVPEHYRQGILKRAEQALAAHLLCDKPGAHASLCLEIQLNGLRGRLEIDWSDLGANGQKEWALKQWECAHE